ncbi:response regulator [Phenylobacterium sp.]|uniref:response regulator n=1 Tax=Phenylobacterium sp. TaxID=1871053 RepID=UPI0035617334
MQTNGRTEFRELAIGLGAMVAAAFVVALIVWANIAHLETTDAARRHTRDKLAQDAAVLEAMVDQETGLRGFAITGDPRFLQPYESGRLHFGFAIHNLKALVVDDPNEVRIVADIEGLAGRWTDRIAMPAIERARSGRRATPDELTGKGEMDAIRADIALLRRSLMDVLPERDAAQARAFLWTRWTLAAGSGLAVAFSLLIGGRSFWQLIAARREAEAAAARLADALEGAHAADRAKTLFLSNMSHEMRTPLNGVAGMAEALGRTRLDASQSALVSVIRASAATMDSLIGDLLTLSRGHQALARPQDQTVFHLGDAMRAFAADYRASAKIKGLTLHAAIAADAEVQVIGDKAKLDQLLACLLSNAVKFTDRGDIRLKLTTLAAHRYRIEVTDTGVGFHADRQAAMFETFSQADEGATRRHGGAGLGLALARQLTADLGGQLSCDSRPGEGSTFTFDLDLPTVGAERPAMAEDPLDELTDEAPLRVLVVDDNATNRKVLELILEALGVEWVSVEDGQQAVDAVGLQDFAAILMDIQMPVMDGLTATREIRRLEREAGRLDTPVIIVSANGEPKHVQAGRAAGAQMHLTKPVSAQTLADALNDVLAEAAKAAEATEAA